MKVLTRRTVDDYPSSARWAEALFDLGIEFTMQYCVVNCQRYRELGYGTTDKEEAENAHFDVWVFEINDYGGWEPDRF